MVNITNKIKKKSFPKLLFRALFPRFLFLGHGLLCIWIVTKQEKDTRFWFLLICLFLLVFEGLYNAIVRHGKEFHWFCPSAFLYCVVLIVTISFLRERQIQCLINDKCNYELYGEDIITKAFSKWLFPKRVTIIEQTGMLVLIIGRWLLPSGSISKEQFSQILLIYIGTAADIVEFNEIYNNDVIQDVIKVGGADNLLHGVMAVWALAILQFSFTVALPEDGLKHVEKEETFQVEKMSYFNKIKSNHVTPISYMHYKSRLREEFSDSEKLVLEKKDLVKELNGLHPKRSNASTTSANNNDNNLQNSGQINSVINKNNNSNEKFISYFESTNIRSEEIDYFNSRGKSSVTLPTGLRNPQNVGSPPVINRSHSSMSYVPISQNKNSISIKNDNNINLKNRESEAQLRFWPKLFKSSKQKNNSEYNLKNVRKDSDQEDDRLGIGKDDIQNCFVKYIDFIGIMMAIFMQDGPFFIFRFVLIVRYQVVTEMIILLTVKNALVIIVQVYRMLNMLCSEPKQEDLEVDDATIRIRNAIEQNNRFSSRLSLKRQRAGLALTALARMQILSKDNPPAIIGEDSNESVKNTS
ncbi:uncharacterized protein LOC100208207 isoform X1 [Hydra vulgaris]|uniref:uncharacterized protein LOC100208207 isoform X1 n=2 Tax=Hydra vulgaris TaxID=6087 RepID=UPI001F5EB311|nr:uncharacterized protein LOC100208207 isoform X1 [Hydra vulgaris]XP_047143493.1 uncharacterized protein LOC100208207 isoform X1 [Hydra vulgaris]XP_047143494.1 uncharacterized protein LOC100208207 isoform X1 [Hydra vulgaris]